MDRPIERKVLTRRQLLTFGPLAALGLVLLLSLASGFRGRQLRVRVDRLRIATVSEGLFQEYVPLIGEVVPIRTVYLDAVEGGRVEEVLVREGARVDAGTPLLRLANTHLLLDIMYREAELFQQSNNLRNTELALEQHRLAMRQRLLEIDHELRDKRRHFESLERLAEAGLVSENDFARARDDYEYLRRLRELTEETERQDARFRENQIRQLRSSLERMEANLGIARKNLDDLVIRAPVSGHLTSLVAEIGQSKARGERLGKIDVLDGFKLRAWVDEHYITRLAAGQRASLHYAERDYLLSLHSISAEVQGGRTEVELTFAGGEPEGIRRGQSLHVRLELGDAAQALLLERGGFLQDTGGRWVYILDEAGRHATRRPVRLGLANPRHCQVLEGLVPGERVIVSSYADFADVDRLLLEHDEG